MAVKSNRRFLNTIFAVAGAALFLWMLYLGNYAYFHSWHFEDSEARFLVLGDPQMEGDARIARQGAYGQVDIMYNDAYFKHIVSTIMKYLSPTHVFVLGDLFSSQYISDREFTTRQSRYANVFESVIKKQVPLYNITGNHDLGYAGEATAYRVQRFESAFGPVNDELVVAGHVIGIVNSVNIDTSLDENLREETWEHMQKLSQKSKDNNMPLIMMTHIPLHKETYGEENFKNVYSNGNTVELCTDRSYTTHTQHGHIGVQNMILPESSQSILDSIQPAFVFTGHDHDGCIYRHNDQTVEYTIRSMMGEFGGYAGLFEIRRNDASSAQPFSYHYTPCPFVSTTLVTITLITAVVFLFVVASVNMFYVVLPPNPHSLLPQHHHLDHLLQQEKKFEYEEECVEELGYAKAKSA